jgi:hypothetical protein
MNTENKENASVTAAQAVRVPEGFALVPVKLTEEMKKAGGHANSEWLNDNAPIGEVRYAMPMDSVYAAMLAAAPAAPTAKEAEQVRDAALEDAAKACEDVAIHWHQFDDTYAAGKKSGALGCATTIRALKRPAGDTQGEQQ